MTLLTYRARLVKGGPLERAQPKTGHWFYEPKYNGWRALVRLPTGTILNRKGHRLSIAREFDCALAALKFFDYAAVQPGLRAQGQKARRSTAGILPHALRAETLARRFGEAARNHQP